ncbi:MAG: sulfatase [Bacteroidota bacterium]
MHVRIISIFLLIFFSSACDKDEKHAAVEQSSPPNIVFIISDDQAWNDYGFMGHSVIETPHLDQLARESLTFSRGYVAAPLCSPSLATIMSGLYPHQHGITGNDPSFTSEQQKYSAAWRTERSQVFRPSIENYNDLPLLTKRLEKLGYLSFQTGKWWMGSWKESHFTHGMTHGDPQRMGRHGDEGLRIGREGLKPIYDFISEAEEKDKPFFLWYAPFLPHAPHTPPEELFEKYKDKAPTPAIANYWAMCEWFDQTCGELLAHLESKQLTKETLVVYVCDNGWIQEPDKPNRYAARSKRTPYEGGIRTPLMFRWPGKITPAINETTLASSIDIVPTVLAACKLEKDEDLPGINILNADALKERSSIFAEAYEHDIASLEDPTLSLTHRIGLSYPWKMIIPDQTNRPDDSIQLYDLSQDPFEKENVIEKYPSEAQNLSDQLDAWWTPEHLKK